MPKKIESRSGCRSSCRRAGSSRSRRCPCPSTTPKRPANVLVRVGVVRHVVVGLKLRVRPRSSRSARRRRRPTTSFVDRAEVAAVDRVGELRHPRPAAARRDADDAGQRVAAVDARCSTRAALPRDRRRSSRHRREVEAAADVVGRHAVDQHLVEVRRCRRARRATSRRRAAPVWTTCAPGTSRSASSTSGLARARASASRSRSPARRSATAARRWRPR